MGNSGAGYSGGSLVFGGIVGASESFTIYAGSLEDPSLCSPTIAFLARNHPLWAQIPADLQVFDLV